MSLRHWGWSCGHRLPTFSTLRPFSCLLLILMDCSGIALFKWRMNWEPCRIVTVLRQLILENVCHLLTRFNFVSVLTAHLHSRPLNILIFQCLTQRTCSKCWKRHLLKVSKLKSLCILRLQGQVWRNDIIYNDLGWTFPFGGIAPFPTLSHEKKFNSSFFRLEQWI